VHDGKAGTSVRAIAGHLPGNLAHHLADLGETELDFAVRWCIAKVDSLSGAGHEKLAAVVRELGHMAEWERSKRLGRS
jgi:hypothetical protein